MMGRKAKALRRALRAGLMCGGLFGCAQSPVGALLALPSVPEAPTPSPSHGAGPAPSPLPMAAYAGGAPAPSAPKSPGTGIGSGRIALVQDNRWEDKVLLYDASSLQPLARSPEAGCLGPELPKVSADGRYVVYMGQGLVGRRAVVWDVGQARELSMPALDRVEVHDPDLAGDGASLILMTGPLYAPQLAVYDLRSDALMTVTLPASLLRNAREPSLSADGQTAAYVARSPLGDDNLVVINLRTQVPLTPPTLNSGADDVDPVLSADGRLLLFSSNRNGSYDLYGYDLVAQRYVELGDCNTLADERHPRWLGREGGGYAFSSDQSGATQVYVRPLGRGKTP